MRKTLFFILMVLMSVAVLANDGVYFTSGNLLVPTKETDISVAKEILTITIGKDSMATVDVYYEFRNNGDAKTVTMAFEAEPPYNANAAFCPDGRHPFIKDFTVVMNDQPLAYDNKVIAVDYFYGERSTDFLPLDLNTWKGWGDAPEDALPAENVVYNAELDSLSGFAYGYFFNAHFKQGTNIVHHTYSFHMSANVIEKFDIPYWLTPATRWANHQVDDFTLRIKAEEPVQDFCMADSLFLDAPFQIVGGDGEFHQMLLTYGEHVVYVSLGPEAVLEWHGTNFCPKANLNINAPERVIQSYYGTGAKVVVDRDGNEYRYLGDCGDTYFVSSQDVAEIPKAGCRVVEYTPENGKGWVYPADLGRYNVRQLPTTKSPVVASLQFQEGELPDVAPCLGMAQEQDSWNWWYKIKVDGKIGYIRQDLVMWDPINSF